MKRHELRRLLERAGRSDTPAPDPAFSDAVGRRIEAVAGAVEMSDGADVHAAALQSWRRRALVPVAAAVVALLAAVALVQSNVEDRDTGVATDKGDREVTDLEQSATTTSSTTTAPPPPPAPVVVPTTEPAPAPTTTTTVRKPPTTTTSTTVPPPREPTPLTLKAAKAADRSVTLGWTRYDGADFAEYVVLRSEGRNAKAPEPTWPPGENTIVMARITNVDEVRFVDQIPKDLTDVQYRVYALDRTGAIVALSPAVRPS